MSNKNWTPGPWYVTGNMTRYVEAKIPGRMIQEVAACGPTAADNGYGAQQESNANLIAAAPDLYDVCERLLDALPYVSEYDVPLGLWDDIRAALAKARGEA